MAKGDITPARLSGVAADTDLVALEFNDGELVIGLDDAEGPKVVLALAEALGTMQALPANADRGDFALQATRIGLTVSPEGHEIYLRFWLIGDLRVAIAVPAAHLPQVMAGFAEIQRAPAKPTN